MLYLPVTTLHAFIFHFIQFPNITSLCTFKQLRLMSNVKCYLLFNKEKGQIL